MDQFDYTSNDLTINFNLRIGIAVDQVVSGNPVNIPNSPNFTRRESFIDNSVIISMDNTYIKQSFVSNFMSHIYTFF